MCVGLLVALLLLPPRLPRPGRPAVAASGWCGSSRSTWSACCCSGSPRCGPRATASRPRVSLLAGARRRSSAASSAWTAPTPTRRRSSRRSSPPRCWRWASRAWSCSSCCCSGRSSTRHPHTEDDWDARGTAGAHLRLGHAGLLRAARRQELLLRPRRRGVPRLHLRRRLRAGRGRPDRPPGVGGRGARRVPRVLRGARLEPGAARRARGEHAAVRLPRLLGVLPRRRGDHRLPRRSRWARPQVRCAAAVRRVGRTLPVPDDPGVAGLATAGRAAQRDQRAVAGQEPGARVHDVAVAGRRRRGGEPGVPAVRRARRATATPGGFLRVVPAYGPAFGYTLDLMRHDPGRAQRHDRVPHLLHRRWRSAAAAWPGCR